MAEGNVEQQMCDAEAREWIQRVRKEGHGRASGDRRLLEILGDIEKRRKKPAADDLRTRIERELGRKLAW